MEPGCAFGRPHVFQLEGIRCATTDVSLSFTGAAYPTGATNLLDGYWYASDPSVFTFSGLSAGQKYDLYVYSNETTILGGMFTVNGMSKQTAGGNDTTFVAGGLANAPLVSGSNYVVFDSVTADSSVKSPLPGCQHCQSRRLFVDTERLPARNRGDPRAGNIGIAWHGIPGLLAYAWRKRK